MSSKRMRGMFLAIGCFAIAINTAVAGQTYTAVISQLEGPSSYEDCLWFTLSGAPQADPINPNSPFFAMPRTQIGYGETFALLLGAKLSGSAIQVVTTGTAAGGACGGYAGIVGVTIQ